MTPEEKGRKLLQQAWDYFWRHCGDPAVYYEDYIDTKFPCKELDEAIFWANEIINHGGGE